jgi:hypothetical protein
MRTTLWIGILWSLVIGAYADLPGYVKADSVYDWSKSLEGKVQNSAVRGNHDDFAEVARVHLAPPPAHR